MKETYCKVLLEWLVKHAAFPMQQGDLSINGMGEGDAT
jgi:hypothetical protein